MREREAELSRQNRRRSERDSYERDNGRREIRSESNRFNTERRDLERGSRREELRDERMNRETFNQRSDERIFEQRHGARNMMNRLSNEPASMPDLLMLPAEKSSILSGFGWQMLQFAVLGAIVLHIMKKDDAIKPKR